MEIVFHLKQRVLHRGCAEHIAAGLGCASDWKAHYENLYSNVSGPAFLFHESGGGDWIRVTDELGRRWEHAHLSKYLVKSGDIVKAGQLIGITGNSGTTTTGPHDHLQIILPNGKRIDPVPLLANAPLPVQNPMPSYENKIIRLNEDPGKGALAYVKSGTNQKQLINAANAGLASITWLARIPTGNFPTDFYENVSKQVWDGFGTVPAGTWF